MITLITGAPGAGKTAALVDLLTQRNIKSIIKQHGGGKADGTCGDNRGIHLDPSLCFSLTGYARPAHLFSVVNRIILRRLLAQQGA